MRVIPSESWCPKGGLHTFFPKDRFQRPNSVVGTYGAFDDLTAKPDVKLESGIEFPGSLRFTSLTSVQGVILS